MRAIDALREEHRAIDLVLSCLERLALMGESTKKIDADCARLLVQFFDDFIKCHVKKEEAILLPLLEEKPNFARRRAAFSLLCLQHQQCDVYVATLTDFLSEAQDPHYADRFVKLARRFIQTARLHMCDEEECLLSFVDSVLSDQEQTVVVQAFEKLDRNASRNGVPRSMIQAARKLAEQFGVPCAQDEWAVPTPRY